MPLRQELLAAKKYWDGLAGASKGSLAFSVAFSLLSISSLIDQIFELKSFMEQVVEFYRMCTDPLLAAFKWLGFEAFSREIFDCWVIVLLAWIPRLRQSLGDRVINTGTPGRHQPDLRMVLAAMLSGFILWAIIPITALIWLAYNPNPIVAAGVYMLGVFLSLRYYRKYMKVLDLHLADESKDSSPLNFFEDETVWEWRFGLISAHCSNGKQSLVKMVALPFLVSALTMFAETINRLPW